VKTDIRKLIHELRARFQAQIEEVDPISWSTLTLHPVDYADLMSCTVSPEFRGTDPPTYANIVIRETALIPEGVAVLVKHNAIIATVNLDDGVIQLWDIPENEGKVRSLR